LAWLDIGPISSGEFGARSPLSVFESRINPSVVAIHTGSLPAKMGMSQNKQ
jgi:hypothetical protein